MSSELNSHGQDNVVFLLSAVQFSADKHRDQRRKDKEASPYINHPIYVATLLATIAEIHDPDILAAAILHDTIEDTKTTSEELASTFGARVCSLVQEVTDDKKLPKAERKRLQIEHAHRLSVPAKLIKIADKIANVRDVTDQPPADWTIERRQEYLDWAERVVAGCRGVNGAIESLFDDLLRRARKALLSA